MREQFHLAHASGVSHVCSPDVERAFNPLSPGAPPSPTAILTQKPGVS